MQNFAEHLLTDRLRITASGNWIVYPTTTHSWQYVQILKFCRDVFSRIDYQLSSFLLVSTLKSFQIFNLFGRKYIFLTNKNFLPNYQKLSKVRGAKKCFRWSWWHFLPFLAFCTVFSHEIFNRYKGVALKVAKPLKSNIPDKNISPKLKNQAKLNNCRKLW